MADNSKISTKIKHKSLNPGVKLLNRLLILFNIFGLGLVAYHAKEFMDVYSKKEVDLMNEGRILQINTKTNKITLIDISDQELEERRNVTKVPATEEKAAADNTEQNSEAPAPMDYNTANLAVIITEFGMKQADIELIKTLPKEVTVAFSPYADELQKKIDEMRKDGRQVMLNLMMQPSNFPMKDNGPYSIQSNFDDSLNISHFNTTANIAKNYDGLLATDNDSMTSKSEKMNPVLQKINEKNVFLGYFRTSNNSKLEDEAKPLSADVVAVDYLIDENPGEEQVAKILNIVREDLLLKKRRVVIALHPHPTSVKALKAWLDTNIGPTIQMAPISYFVTKN